MRDYTAKAEALFAGFAERHGLRYEADTSAPVEVLWSFPQQDRLRLPIVLALQNDDELNFGVGDFWSYFFPFERACQTFEQVIDAWVAGEARITPISWWTDALQVRQADGRWETRYRASRILPSFRGRPTLRNR